MRPLTRLVQILAVLACLSFGLFVLLHAMPGGAEDPILAMNPELSRAELDRIRTLRGLDHPIHERYFCWLAGRGQSTCTWWPGGQGILRGDLGWSRVHGLPVRTILADRLQNTLAMMIPSLLLALLGALTLGTWAALRRGRAADRLVSLLAFVGLSWPVHWFALVAVMIFAVHLGWLPASGIDDPASPTTASKIFHLVLPVSILALYYLGRWSRYVRASVLETVALDHVVAARARGLSEAVILRRHVLRPALLPIITVVGQTLPVMFSGALVVERVFAYPGMGMLVFESIEQSDFMVAMVVALAYAALTMFIALIADVLYTVADPRLQSPEGTP